MGRRMQQEELETRSLIIALLRKRMGFGIELFGLLSIDTLDNGEIRVINQTDVDGHIEDGHEKIFAVKDMKKAVDYFLELRWKRRLGFDIQKE